MHVSVRDAGTHQIVRLRPIKLPIYWLSGGLFIGMGLVVLMMWCVQTQVSCRPSTAGGVWCVVDTNGWVRTARTEGWLSNAHLEDRTRAGFIAVREAVLTLGAQRVRLDLIAADGDDKAALVARLDALLSGRSTAPAGYQEDARFLMSVLGVALLAAGGIILASIERIRIVLDRERQLISIRGRGSAIERRQSVTADRIRDVRSRSFPMPGGSSYNVILHLAGEGEATVARAPLFTEESATRLVTLLRAFLRDARRRPAARRQAVT